MTKLTPLYKHISKEHGLTLTDSQLNDIFNICIEVYKTKHEPEDIVPDWSTAPDWSQYWAVNSGITGGGLAYAYWYENKPVAFYGKWVELGGMSEFAAVVNRCDWQTSLKKRPIT